MKLNCKNGNMAIVISGPSAGAIVTCLELYPAGSKMFVPGFGLGTFYRPHWRIDRALPTTGMAGRAVDLKADECLRPLRDTDGDDETLTWAGKPEKVTA